MGREVLAGGEDIRRDPSYEGERSPLLAPGVDVIVDDHGAVVGWPLVKPGVIYGAWKDGGACL